MLQIHVFLFPGITLPSAFSAFYFLLFIGVCTWWACHFPISHLGFNTLCVMVAFFTGGHLVCLYLYQSSFAQEMFSPVGLWARYCSSLLSSQSLYIQQHFHRSVYSHFGQVVCVPSSTSLFVLEQPSCKPMRLVTVIFKSRKTLTPFPGSTSFIGRRTTVILNNMV